MEPLGVVYNDSSILGSPVFHYIFKVSVGTASCLSILGASLIITTYVVFPELRTTLRQILVNLSIADLICATAFLVGIGTNFYHRLDPDRIPYKNQSEGFYYICVIQGGFAVLGTDASILWTMSMAVYMFVVVVLRRPEGAGKLLVLHYLICWGVPTVITVVFGAIGWLGFDPGTTPGYCDITTHPDRSGNSSGGYTTVLPVVIRYTLFLYTSFLLLPPLFLAIRCSLLNLVGKWL